MLYRLKQNIRIYISNLKTYWLSDASFNEPFVRWGVVGAILHSTFLLAPPSHFSLWLNGFSEKGYNPVGLLYYFHIPFNISFIEISYYTLLVSSIFVILGLFQKLASLIFTFSAIVLFTFNESFHVWGWSHGYNILLLALVSYLPIGLFHTSKWSIDYILKKKLGFSFQNNTVPQMLFIILQANIALMFFNAAFWKLTTSGLAWAFSDNMRNILAIQYLFIDLPLPVYLEPIVNNQWLYKGMAFGNLIAQSLPFFTVFSRSFWLRCLGGLFFCMVNLGLDLVMNLPSPAWYALVVVFIDWKYIFKKSTVLLSIPYTHKKYISAFVITIIIWGVAFSPLIKHNLDKLILKLYPLSAFPMYSSNLSEKPYLKHKPYYRPKISYNLLDEKCTDKDKVMHLMQTNFYGFISFTKLSDILMAAQKVCPLLEARFKCKPQVEIYREISMLPAYPAKFELQTVIKGLFTKINCESGAIETLGLQNSLDYSLPVQTFLLSTPTKNKILSYRLWSLDGESEETACVEVSCDVKGWNSDKMGSVVFKVLIDGKEREYLVY